MRDAAVERLTKLISQDSSRDVNGGKGMRKPLEIRLRIEEGWFSLFLLATVVYCTIWSVQVARWVDHLNVLSLTTLVGLTAGVIAAKQKRFPTWLVHVGVLLIGLLFAYWQTAGAFYDGSATALWQGLGRWFAILVNNSSSDDDSIFLFMILELGYILAYTSAWLVYRTRSPWLMIGANGVVLLINLSNVDGGFFIFLVIFLVASLLLLLRFNLHESIKRWRRQGLRYSDELSWDVMQGGALISIGILIFSWLMPAGYTDPTISQIWNANASPIIQLQNTWNRVIALDSVSPSNHGNFRDTLTLAGNPNLNDDLVFSYQTDGDGSQYLQLLSYDVYTMQGWQVGSTDRLSLKANLVQPSRALSTRTEKQTITVVNPPGEQNPYLIGAPEIVSVSLPANLIYNKTDSVVAWLGAYGNVPAGTKYSVASSVSGADIKTLRTVPLPANAPKIASNFDGPLPAGYFDPTILQTYTQLPSNLDVRIVEKAQQVSSSAATMYDKVVDLESYLRTHYAYDVNIQRPMNQEGVSWFLFNSDNRGFCNYFASAMVVMARSLGIPARVAVGYTSGVLNTKSHQREVYGKDAHAWVQVYFAGYGWVNFEPSASFSAFTRPVASQGSSSTTITPGSTGGLTGNVPGKLNPRDIASEQDPSSSVSNGGGQVALQQVANVTLGSLILLLLFGALIFSIWWRRLFRRYGLSEQVYGRLCLIASWAGIRLHPSLTPYEYVEEVAQAAPAEVTALERVGDIYVRDRWADPESQEHPRRSGEMSEMESIWKRLQPRLFLHVVRHPHFLRWLPERIGDVFDALRQRRKSRRLAEADDF